MKIEFKKLDINFKILPSDELIEYISFKCEFPEEAELAFTEFCSRFQTDILQKAEIYSKNMVIAMLLHWILQTVLLLKYGNTTPLKKANQNQKILTQQLNFGFIKLFLMS